MINPTPTQIPYSNVHKIEYNLADINTTGAMTALLKAGGPIWQDASYSCNPKNLPGIMALVLRNGDLATTDRVNSARKNATALALPHARSVRPVWAEKRLMGTRVDVNAALRGEPRAWGRFERVRSNGVRTVALHVPVGGLASRSLDEMGWGPVAAIVIADILEGAGYRCEIWASSLSESSRSGFDAYAARAVLKRAEDPCDINAIARIAHPDFFRGVVLPMRWRDSRGKCGEGYGSTRDPIAEIWGDEGAISVRHAYNAHDCLAEIKRVIAMFAE